MDFKFPVSIFQFPISSFQFPVSDFKFRVSAAMLSDVLLKKFDQVISHYPLKRSAIVPCLLFAQDEIGFISDEVIEEVARRVDVRPIEVIENISYYSMLHRKPIGKYSLQVCTNVSCMVRGGEEILEHCKKRLGIGHKETTPDGLFSLEEVECLGACCGAPAMQVNYDFYEDLTPEKVDTLLDRLRTTAGSREGKG
jgi:NADH-quinone oxidoreductase subunit E